MPHVLGVDLGASRLSAAVSQVTASGWAPGEIVCDVPAVLSLSADGSFMVGEPAGESAVAARDFVARVGDDVPLLLGGQGYHAHTLAAMMVAWAADRAAAWQGEPPEHVVISHPSGWGRFRRESLRAALWELRLADATLMPKPIAAAEPHPGRLVGVYALGRNGFATSVLRRGRTAETELLACLEGTRPLGSEDFVAALAAHTGADMRESEQALDELAHAAETTVRGALVTRAEVDGLIAPAVRVTVDTLLRTVDLAGLRPDQLDELLLIGWPAQLPLIAGMIRVDFPGRITVAPRPRFAAALGAATAAARLLTAPAAGEPTPSWPLTRQAHELQLPSQREGEPEPPPRPPVRITTLKLPRRRSPARLAHARGFSLFGL